MSGGIDNYPWGKCKSSFPSTFSTRFRWQIEAYTSRFFFSPAGPSLFPLVDIHNESGRRGAREARKLTEAR
jgi:hypothetical protein